MKSHIRCWNIWRKMNANGKLYKFLVLIKLNEDISFSFLLRSTRLIKRRNINLKTYADCKKCVLAKYCRQDDWDLCHWRPDNDIIHWEMKEVQNFIPDDHPRKEK